MLAPARPDQEHLHGGRVYSPRLTSVARSRQAWRRRGRALDHFRVELRPRAAAELLERLLGGASGAVGPVGRDRAVGVAAADDPRDERDLLADEPIRVAATVEALVAGAHEVPDVAEHAADAVEHLLAHDGVRLDDRALLGRSAGRAC